MDEMEALKEEWEAVLDELETECAHLLVGFFSIQRIDLVLIYILDSLTCFLILSWLLLSSLSSRRL